MPIPTPKGPEKESQFISRCMSEIGDEYTDKDQALAVCYTQWRESKGINMTSEQRVLRKLNAIPLNPSVEEMKEPCWDGYEQYGTKIVDGREVPNCIPIE